MIIFAKNKKEIIKLLEEILKKEYPKQINIAIYIDDGISKGIVSPNNITNIDIRHDIETNYNNALDALETVLNRLRIQDLYLIPRTTNGIKITIKKDEEKEMKHEFEFNDFVLTDAEIEKAANTINKECKTNNPMATIRLTDAATYGFNLCYDMMLQKIYNKAKAQEKAPTPPKTTDDETITIAEAAEVFQLLLDMLNK